MALKPQGNNIVGGTSLAIDRINSPGYVAGVSGWTINQDGSAEFNNVTIRGGTTIGGTSLWYSTATPQANTLVESVSSVAGMDSAGNYVLAGHAAYHYSAVHFSFAVAVTDFGVIWYSAAAGTLGPWTEVQSVIVNAVSGILTLSNAVIAGELTATGGTPASPSVISTDTWNAMSPLLNSWAAIAGNVTNQYRLVASPPNTVEVIGTLDASSATSTKFFTLPAGYVPASQQGFPVGTFSGSAAADNVPFLQCDTSGNLTIQQRTATQTSIRYHGLISLDA